MDNYCGSITKFIDNDKEYNIQSSLDYGGCVFRGHKPDDMRMETSEKCQKCGGHCCQVSPCGPWLPCDFLNQNSIRNDIDTTSDCFIKEDLDSPHDLNWGKISNYIKDGKAIIKQFSFDGKPNTIYYIVDIPANEEICQKDETNIETNKELGKCALLGNKGCILSLNERPLLGAVFGSRDIGGCFQLDDIGSYNCWTNDPYLQDKLKELYDMYQND
jgi:Fe-S-cluster containining protein